MTLSPLRISAVLVVAAAFFPPARAAGTAADIVPPDKRRAAVETAERLARPAVAAPLPPKLAQPFSPENFDQVDPSEARDVHSDANSQAAATPAAAPTDRDLLEAVADKIPTTGTIILGGKPLLVSGTNRIEVGSRFTVVYNGQEYELELTAIDRTTFTVRYKGEEFTRPIKLGRTP